MIVPGNSSDHDRCLSAGITLTPSERHALAHISEAHATHDARDIGALIRNGLIRPRPGINADYMITPRGLAVLATAPRPER